MNKQEESQSQSVSQSVSLSSSWPDCQRHTGFKVFSRPKMSDPELQIQDWQETFTHTHNQGLCAKSDAKCEGKKKDNGWINKYKNRINKKCSTQRRSS